MIYRAVIGLLATFVIAACANWPSQPPGNQTVLDERAAIAVESAYQASALAIEVAVDSGMVDGDRAARLAKMDRDAYAAVRAVRVAYDVGNAASYEMALMSARAALAGALLALNEGDTP